MGTYRRTRGGYTILEVIIVLTVSSMLFAASIVGFNQQNRRTQFTDSVNNFAQNIQDVLNDVETGFYPSNNSFSCTALAAGFPIPSPTAAQQGTNESCIFVGKAIQFAPGPSSPTNKANIDIYTIIGRRLVENSTKPVSSINDAKPIGLDNLVDRKTLSAGVEIISVKQAVSGQAYSGIAMVSTSGTGGGINTGLNARASLASIAGNINNTKGTFLNNIRAINSSNVDQARDGIYICVKEGGTGGRSAIIELATDRSQIIVNTKVDAPCT
jgi:type II secretory pathway pseudopilin PulG